MKKIKIYPSLISADVLNLQKVINELEPHCDGFHIDVMDNHFVPNLTWGPMMVNAIAKYARKPVFVHLMVDDPETLVENLELKPNSIVSFHIESNSRIEGVISLIKEKKLIPSLAISPKTAIESIFDVAHVFDQILLMSVNPGSSGQPFLPGSIERLNRLNEFRKNKKLDFEISMDGGINEKNIHELALGGATIFGIASAIFSKANPIKAIEELYVLAQK